MTTKNEGSLLTSLERFESFGRRYAAGLGQRRDEPVEASTAEVRPTTRAELLASIPEGALLGRGSWEGEAGPMPGIFLWSGPISGLLGEDAKPILELTDDDLATLDTQLRLAVEEGGEDPLPVEWTGLERLSPEAAATALESLGVSEECEIATVGVRLGEQALEFRFAAAAHAAEAGAVDPGATEAELPATTAEAEGVQVAEEAPFEDPLRDVDLEGGAGPEPTAAAPEELGNLPHLLDVRMPLTIRLGSMRMTLDKLLRLAPGVIVELDQREEEPLEVLANGHVIARGEVVVLDERFGLRITEIGGAEERLRATL